MQVVMALSSKISTRSFIYSQLLIFIVGLIFIAGLYYLLDIQYQKSDNPFLAGPVTSVPKSLRLNLDSPDDDSLSFQSSVIVSGQTTALKDVLIFTNSQNIAITAQKDGSFSTVLKLDEGVNRIVVSVFDTNGESKSEIRTVYYSKEKI